MRDGLLAQAYGSEARFPQPFWLPIVMQTNRRISRERIQVATKKFSLDQRAAALRASQSQLDEARRRQDCRSGPVLDGLRWYLEQARDALQYRTWARVLQHFMVFPIEAHLPVERPVGPGPQGQGEVRFKRELKGMHGISTIAGVPLPNVGHHSGSSMPGCVR
jgi:hypothetical protein